MATVPATDWEGESVQALRHDWGVPELRVFHRVGSTSDVARQMAEQGAAAGSVVIAREQLAGRGRRGRRWEAPPGSSLLLSMVLRPPSLGADAVLSLRLGLAAARAIEAVAPVAVGLKWPNDLVVHHRKVGGILCEGSIEGGRPLHVIAGIGINLSQGDMDWPPDIAATATSLAAATGSVVPPRPLADHLVAAWKDLASADARALSDPEMREFRRRDILHGRTVAVDDEPVGVATGIAPDGALLVRRAGATRPVVAGTVRALDEPERARP